ncbi:hypothetical protein Btru_002320 [Bulinus truncatus]|nr:hypothetical protein Btru_002320 [Bulinus truncatus]
MECGTAFCVFLATCLAPVIATEVKVKWPIENCFGVSIDLVLIADASSRLDDQMRFHQRLLDLVSPSYENSLERLRVAMLTIPPNLSTTDRLLNVVVRFDSHQNKSDLKESIIKGGEQFGQVSLETILGGQNTGVPSHRDELNLRKNALTAFIATASSSSMIRWCKTQPLLFLCSALSGKVFLTVFHGDDASSLNRSIPAIVGPGYYVSSLDDVDAVKKVFSKVCQPCLDGWYPYELHPNSNFSSVISCYFIQNAETPMNWMDASRKCEQKNSELVSIETSKEHNFLQNKLRHSRFITEDKVGVFIGLKREEYSVGRRFRWISQMPLVHTVWGSGHPKNGLAAGCVVWLFYTQADAENRTDSWESIGCGHVKWSVFVCEMNYRHIKHWLDDYSQKFKSRRPDGANIDGALLRSQLILSEDGNHYVSLTAVPSAPDLFIARPNQSQQAVSLVDFPLYVCVGQARIFYNFVCESRPGCGVRRDETSCQWRACLPDEYRCRSGKCIPKEQRCDLRKDCEGGDDEWDCYQCRHARCPDGRCLPKHWFGDGEVDCESCTEHGVENELVASQDPDIISCVFLCNRTQCVYERMLNDGVVDCQGPEGPLDETLGALENTTCYERGSTEMNYSNWAPRCIFVRDMFNEPIGCRNMKHLERCDKFRCPDGYVKCPGAYCIPFHYVHNNMNDCPDGEDESSSALLECPGYFLCDREERQKICLHPNYVCDGQNHCPDGDDEINCNVKCLRGLQCISGTVVAVEPDAEVDLGLIDPSTRFIDISGLNAPNVFHVQPTNFMSKLLVARFSSCNIASLNSSSEFHSLTTLDLSRNLIEAIAAPSVLGYMPKLNLLNLSGNSKLSIIDESGFKQGNFYRTNINIVTLDLSFTAVRNLSFVKSFPSLKNLILTKTPIDMESLVSGLDSKRLSDLDLRGIQNTSIWPKMFKNLVIERALQVDNYKLCCRQLHNSRTSLKECAHVRDPFSSCCDLMTSTILRVLLWTTGLFSILGNAAVIVYRFVYDRKSFGMGYGHFVAHLSISDLLMGVYLVVIASADMHYRGNYLLSEQYWRSSAVCMAAGFLSTLSSEISIFFVFLITLDRFLVIRFPFGQVRIRRKAAILICALTWAAGIVLASIPGLHHFGHWSVYTTTGVCAGLPFNRREDAGWLYSQTIFIYVNFLLFLLITAGQVVIYRAMDKMRMPESCLTDAGSRRAQDMTVAKNLLLVVVADFLCWFPIGVLGLMTLCGHQMDKDVYAWTVVLVLPINSAINPVLYTIPSIVQHSRNLKYRTFRTTSQTTSM